MSYLSTLQLCESTSGALGGRVSIDECLSVWHSVGKAIKTQLGANKGVRLPLLGNFSLTASGQTTFTAATELLRNYRLKTPGCAAAGNFPVSALNYTQLSQLSGSSRDMCEKVYTKVTQLLGKSILEGRDVLLTIHRVAEISIKTGVLKVDFMGTTSAAPSPTGRPSAATPGSPVSARSSEKARDSVWDAKIQRQQARERAAQANAKGLEAVIAYKAAEPTVQLTAKNNIFCSDSDISVAPLRARATNPLYTHGDSGYEHDPFADHRDYKTRAQLKAGPAPGIDVNSAKARGGGDNSGAIAANSKRPSSGASVRSGVSSIDTMSLLHSPRSNAMVGSADGNDNGRPTGARPGARPRASCGGMGLRKEQLDQLEREQNQIHRKKTMRDEGGNGGVGAALMDARELASKALDMGNVLQTVRDKIIARGGTNGIRSLQRLLAIMDDNGDKRLSKDELHYGLRDYGITLSDTELDQVFFYFDRDRNGFVDVTEFLVGIRGDLNARRKQCIRMAFNVLDTDNSGYVTVEEIADVYDVSKNPDVLSGKRTTKEALLEFMGQWERGEKDGVVTYEEFEDYYKDISASVDDDDYFELMIRNAWRIAGGEGNAANTANLRVLVTDKDGKQKVATVEKELGLKQGDRDDIRKRLMAQGVDAANVELYGGMDATEKPKVQRGGTRPSASAALGRRDYARPPTPPPPVKYDRSAARTAVGLPPTPPAEKFARMSTNSSSKASLSEDKIVMESFDLIQKALYTPPCTVEEMGNKLMVSAVSFSPRIAQGAFITRMSILNPSVNKVQATSMWHAIDPNQVGSLEVSALHSMLASRFGKDKKSASEGQGIIQKVIMKIRARAGEKAGIRGLQRTLMIMDDSGDKCLSKEELKFGLRDYGVELNIRELDEIFQYFDRDRNGSVSITEFLVGIRGDLNARRKQCIRMAFNVLDTDNSGYVTVEEIADVYDVSKNPDVLSGKRTTKEALLEFMGQWERGEKDGVVTYEEFEDYYKEVSASIDGDDYFELMIRNAWRIAGGEGNAANTANLRVLVTDKDGKQKVATVEKELGLKQGDRDDIRKRLMAQGVDAANVELYGGMDATEKPKVQRGGVPIRSLESKGGVDVGNPRSAYNRSMAAIKLAAAFRGRLGRKVALQEKRKSDAAARKRADDEKEANIPRAPRLIRPFPKKKSN